MSAAEVLAQHRSYYVHGDDADRCSGCGWRGAGDAEFEAHQLDALKAAGYAVVELPEPVIANDWDWAGVLPGGSIEDLITDSGLLTVSEARSKAAALLAAADAAEAQS